MPQSITPARKLAFMALARVSGTAEAARAGGVDPRTIAAWLDAEGPDEREWSARHDEAEWSAARQYAQERHLGALLRGETKGLAAWATSAGVAARNERYARLIRRREQKLAERQAPLPPPTPNLDRLKAAWSAQSWEVQRLARNLLDAELDDNASDPPTIDGDLGADEADGFVGWLAQLAALSPEERERQQAQADAAIQERSEAARRERLAGLTAHDEARLLAEAEALLDAEV